MAFRVICISHTDGSGGDAVARAVADRLGFRYVNEEIIAEAARLAHVDPAVVAAAEKKQSLLDRILDSLARAQDALGAAALGAGIAAPVYAEDFLHQLDQDDLRAMIRAAILEVAKAGDAVIGAHAASLALAGKPGVLRVLVTAPKTLRAARVARDRSLGEEEAEALIDKGDRGRRDYMRSFYGIDEELPTHYDAVFSTEHLAPSDVTDLVVALARIPG